MEYILKTPQVGEVGHEVTIVKIHKQIGDYIKKDEPIVTLETNKAALEIESMVSGIVRSIFSDEGHVVPTGSPLLAIQTEAEPDTKSLSVVKTVKNMETIAVENAPSLLGWLKQLKNRDLSPRHKAYCRDQKVVPINFHKDFKDYTTNGAAVENKPNNFYQDITLSKSQTRLLQNLVESQRQIIPANIQSICDNSSIEQYRQRLRNAQPDVLVPSRLEIIAWAVVSAMQKHPSFRSRLIGQNTLRQFKNPNLGIAVALPNDELATAVITNSFSCTFHQFVDQCRSSIIEAKNDNHVTTYHPLVISDLSAQGIVNAIPVIASPACATLFIGCPMKIDRASFYLSLSFDHRFINGSGAAAFLRDVQRGIKEITQ